MATKAELRRKASEAQSLKNEALQNPKIARAHEIITRARADLGRDLGGGSIVDLLLDNMPELSTWQEAMQLALVYALLVDDK